VKPAAVSTYQLTGGGENAVARPTATGHYFPATARMDEK
jgi:hypothetical protein